MGVFFFPLKDDSPLIIDSDTMESFQITAESFQAITGRRSEIPEIGGGVQQVQFPERRCDDIGRESAHLFGLSSVIEVFGGFISEGCNHALCSWQKKAGVDRI
jgi:hypothetical protein